VIIIPAEEICLKPGKKGIARIIAATGYSFQGFRAAWRNEAAFRQELVLAIIFLPFAFWLGETLTHQLLLIMSCALVVLAELLNSAIEAVVDRISDEQHELSGRAKDIGSAAVFVTLTLFVVIWGLSFWQWL
jgi:diacylglycerol kinase (ATP)